MSLFAIGKDYSAVLCAITSPWSGRQVGGQITRLKLVKRQMYGVAKLDLLEAGLGRRSLISCTKTASEPI